MFPPEHAAVPDPPADVVVAFVAAVVALVAAEVVGLLADVAVVAVALVVVPVAVVVFGCSMNQTAAPPTSTRTRATTPTISPVFDFFGGAGGRPPAGFQAPGAWYV
jgi:hypothetical protein